MAIRKPLVTVSGVSSELPPGDTVEGVVLTTTLTAGSGLSGGGSLSTNQRIDLSLASNPSGLILVGNNLSLDGTAQRTADTALASGNAAQQTANTALASGNAALSRAGGTMTGPIIFAAGQQINTAVNLSGGISGAVAYQSAPNLTQFLNPGVSGQVLTTAGNNQAPIWTTPGGGKILQVQSSTTTNQYYTTGTSFTQYPYMTASITPSKSTSKVLIYATLGSVYLTAYTGTTTATIYRDGTDLSGGLGLSQIYDGGGYYLSKPLNMFYLDSPSSTSTLTYSLYFKNTTGIYYYINYNSILISIVLMEVAA